MSRRRTVGALVALAVMATIGGCVGALNTSGSNQVNGPDASGVASIQVSATGTVDADPDQAVLRIAVEATGDDAATARNRLNENVSRMRNALREAGIEDDQVRTMFFDIQQNYRESREGREPAGYRAIEAFEVTLSNVSDVGRIIDVAVNNGANRVDGVQFTLADDTQEALRAQALEQAVDRARDEATVLANASDLQVVGIKSLSTAAGGVTPFRAEMTTEPDAGARTKIEPGPVTVTASVTAVYNASATTA